MRNLPILIVCQLISATGSIVMVTLGGIIGATLSGNPALATLPISAVVVSVALTTVPATILMRRIGRRYGFALASSTAILAVAGAAWSLAHENFAGFVVSLALFGINMAFTQQYRYAAAESVERRLVPRAVSFVLLGAIGGALVGPEIATHGRDLLADVPFGGTFAVLAVLYALQAVLLLQLDSLKEPASLPDAPERRPLKRIITQPVFVVAVLGGVAAYGLMTLIMTATPLSMHIKDGHSLEATADVIRYHVLAMYLPSLVSGFLIERLGVVRLMLTGAACLTATSIVGLQGHSVMHYSWALILLGVGWNFLYVGATTMLTYTYTNEERFHAQAVNEFLVFGASATASLLAGGLMHYFGWLTLMWVPIPLLLLTAASLLFVRRHRLLRQPA